MPIIGVYGWEWGRGTVIVEKGTRRKRSGPLRAASPYQSGTGL